MLDLLNLFFKFIICYGSNQKEKITSELKFNDNFEDNEQINPKFSASKVDLNESNETNNDADNFADSISTFERHFDQNEYKDLYENVENYEIEMLNLIDKIDVNEYADIIESSENENLKEKTEISQFEDLSTRKEDKLDRADYQIPDEGISEARGFCMDEKQSNIESNLEINDDLGLNINPNGVDFNYASNIGYKEIYIDCENIVFENNVEEKSQLPGVPDNEIIKNLEDLERRLINDIIEDAEAINEDLARHNNESTENHIDEKLEQNNFFIEHNEILKTAEILGIEEAKKFINLPFTIDILSERGKRLEINDLKLDEIFHDENQINHSYLVLKIFIKTQARKFLFSCNILIQRIEEILRSNQKDLVYPVSEENEFYKFTLYIKSSKISDLINSEYNYISMKRKQNLKKLIIQSFDLLTIIPNPVSEFGIEKILRWIKINFDRRTPKFYTLSCFIVGFKNNLGFDESSLQNFQNFVDKNEVEIETGFTNNNGLVYNDFYRPNETRRSRCNESQKNEVTISTRRFYPMEYLQNEVELHKHYRFLNHWIDFKFHNNPGTTENPKSSYFILLSKENADIDDYFCISIITKISNIEEDSQNTKKVIDFIISEQKKKKNDEYFGNYLNFKKIQDPEYEDTVDITFNLEWISEKSTNKLSSKNTLKNIEDYNKYMIFIDNINSLVAFYTKLVLSENIVSFENLLDDKMYFLTRETISFLSNFNFKNLTNNQAISFICEYLNLNFEDNSYVLYSYDVNEAIETIDKKNKCDFLKKLIPGIEDHDFYKNEMIKYNSFKIMDQNIIHELLKEDKGIFIELQLSNRKTLYINLRYILGETTELDTNEVSFLESIFDQLSECISQHMVYKYCYYNMNIIRPFLDFKYEVWKVIIKSRDFLSNTNNLPTPIIVDSYISLAIAELKFPEILNDNIPLDKKKVKSLGEICTNSFFSHEKLSEEFETCKVEICKIFNDYYTRIYNQKLKYDGLMLSYFYRSSEIDIKNDFFNHKRSFLL